MTTANQFERLIGSIRDYAIFMLDRDGTVVSWNAGAEQIKRYRTEEIIGEHFSRFYTPEDRATGLPARALAQAAAQGRYEAEGQRVRADGSRFWASVVIDAIYDDDGEVVGFAKVTRDISERRAAEERLRQTRERLFEAQKLEALGQLAGGFAHDFNNLLTTITAGAELGLRLDDVGQLHKILNTIHEAGKRGGHLTRQLLGFARQQPLATQRIAIDSFLSEVADLLRPALRATITLEVAAAPGLAVDSDNAQLELALLNLAFNARDAMPEGGLLRLAATPVTLTGEPDGLNGAFVAIHVEDTGCGIEAELLNRVLEPFFTTKQFEGTGLGLSQAYGFARQAGGTLTLASQPGVGTTASILLPAA